MFWIELMNIVRDFRRWFNILKIGKSGNDPSSYEFSSWTISSWDTKVLALIVKEKEAIFLYLGKIVEGISMKPIFKKNWQWK